MQVTDFHQYALHNNLTFSGDAFAHECCLLLYDGEVKRSVIYDLKSDQTHDVDPQYQYLKMGYDEEHVCLSSYVRLGVFDRHSASVKREISVNGYSTNSGDADVPLPYTMFYMRTERKHKVIDLMTGEERAAFQQPEGLRLIYSRRTPERIDLRPSEIYPFDPANGDQDESNFTFLSYNLKNDVLSSGRLEVSNYYTRFLGYVADYSVYLSLQIGEVIVLSPTGELLMSIPLDGYVYKQMPMVGFCPVGDVFYLLYLSSGDPTLLEVDAKSDTVNNHPAPVPKSKFSKLVEAVTLPIHDGRMIFKDRFIDLDGLKGGAIKFPTKVKWMDRYFNYLGAGRFVIGDFKFSRGIYTGFSLGVFEGATLPENPSIGELEDIERLI